MKNRLAKLYVAWLCMLFAMVCVNIAQAQITNTPTALYNEIAASAGPAFDTGVVIMVAATAIIFAVRYVRKALGGR